MNPAGESAEIQSEKICGRCGKEAVGELGEETLCESCYHGETSCCGRFGDDDE